MPIRGLSQEPESGTPELAYYDGQAVVGEIVRREKMSIGGLLTYYERRAA